MNRKEVLLLMLLLFLAEVFIIAMAPANVELFWALEGLVAGFVFLFEVLTGRIRITRKFVPLLSGILLMALGSLLMRMNFALGLLGFFLDITGLTLVFYGIFHARKVTSDKSLEPSTSETPKSFLKKCAGCGREIPIASEYCPFCQAKQP